MCDRTRLTRKPERRTDDPAVLHRLLDEARIAHVGFVRDGSPVVLPMAMGRDEDRLLLHGSTGAGMFLAARSGIEVSVAVTHLDGARLRPVGLRPQHEVPQCRVVRRGHIRRAGREGTRITGSSTALPRSVRALL
ncbi:pyridoxamine 5'-phosphate oxidase family protein [Rhodococcus aetherivorans]